MQTVAADCRDLASPLCDVDAECLSLTICVVLVALDVVPAAAAWLPPRCDVWCMCLHRVSNVSF